MFDLSHDWEMVKIIIQRYIYETGSNWLQVTAKKGDNQSKMPYISSNSRLDYKNRVKESKYQYALRDTIYHLQTVSSFLKQEGNGGTGTLN